MTTDRSFLNTKRVGSLLVSLRHMTRAALVAGSVSVLLGLGVGIAIASRPLTISSTPSSSLAAPISTPFDAVPPSAATVPVPTTVPPVQSTPTTVPQASPAPVSPPSHSTSSASASSASQAPAPVTAQAPTPVTARGSDGTLSATLTATPSGYAVSFVLHVTDSAASGPVGPSSLSYGDGSPTPETGLPASCGAGASGAPYTGSFDYTHAYSAPGTYTVTVKVSAPCSSEEVDLTLPVEVGATS